jgi:hypothetical protein
MLQIFSDEPYSGIDAFIPPGNESFILAITPFIFAVLAISINATSAWLLRMLEDDHHTDFAKSYLAITFIAFLTYDGLSSFVGLLGEFHGEPITSLAGIVTAYKEIGPARGMLSAAIALLASFSPLLVSVFWDLWSQLGAKQQDEPRSGTMI